MTLLFKALIVIDGSFNRILKKYIILFIKVNKYLMNKNCVFIN